MYGVFHALFRGPNSHNSVWKDTDLLKIVFYRLTPRSKTYSLTFLYDEFMMYKGLYNFQLYSLHKQSFLMYLGFSLIQMHLQNSFHIKNVLACTININLERDETVGTSPGSCLLWHSAIITSSKYNSTLPFN